MPTVGVGQERCDASRRGMAGIGPESSTGKADDVRQGVNIRLFRYRGVLSFIAHRVLNNHLEAEDAVRNCLKTASSTVPRFESEGAFRSWLVRVLMDEALMILYKKRAGSADAG